jgi:hypothetical protein
MVGVTNGDGERVGGVRTYRHSTFELHFDHMRNLGLVSMTNANDGFLDMVRGVFADL